MRACLVSGASGFIGTRLVKQLHAEGWRVIAADIAPPRVRLEGVVYKEVDVREPLPVELGDGVERIYNLAAIHRTPGHPDHEYYETNLLGASRMTAFAEACAIKTIVFTSSISVYGPSDDLMGEDSPLKPVSAYGYSKRLAEVIHKTWQERGVDQRLITIRPGVVFGPGENGNYTRLARALSRGLFAYPGRKDTIKGGGYVDELLAAINFALAQPDPFILFNFAYPQSSTTEDIVGAFAKVCGFKSRYPVVPTAPLYGAAVLFELADKVGVSNSVHRERVLKLAKSTRIEPGWLKSRGYVFSTDLEGALAAWRDETAGAFL